jgi:hypothetical protein
MKYGNIFYSLATTNICVCLHGSYDFKILLSTQGYRTIKSKAMKNIVKQKKI